MGLRKGGRKGWSSIPDEKGLPGWMYWEGTTIILSIVSLKKAKSSLAMY